MFILELCIHVTILYITIGKQNWVSKTKTIITSDNKREDTSGDEQAGPCTVLLLSCDMCDHWP